jgi:chromosome segregation ATPase
VSDEFDKIADFEALMSDWSSARAEVRRLSALLDEGRHRTAQLKQTIDAFPDAQIAANLAHARSQRDSLASEVRRLTAALDEERRKVAEAEHAHRTALEVLAGTEDDCAAAEAELAAMRPVVEAAEALDEIVDHLIGLVVDAQHEHRNVQRKRDFYAAIAEQIKQFEAAVDSYRSRPADPAGGEHGR